MKKLIITFGISGILLTGCVDLLQEPLSFPTPENIEYTEENVTSAFSRIMDTDMAEEMTEYANQQVLNQAGISVLTQANQRPAEVLQLLQ